MSDQLLTGHLISLPGLRGKMEAGWSRMNGKVYSQKELTRIPIYDVSLLKI